jgi:hypothetical protein
MDSAHWFKSHLRDMMRDECFEFLESRQVGRVGFVDPGGPLVLPVKYVIHDESVLIATSSASSLSGHIVGRPVAFEVDEIDELNDTGCSVRVRGQASLAVDELPDAQQPNPWSTETAASSFGSHRCTLVAGSCFRHKRLGNDKTAAPVNHGPGTGMR